LPYTVFLSHSMAPEDQPIIQSIFDNIHAVGAQCYMAERDWMFGHSLGEKLEARLTASDCLVAVLTKGGSGSPYVNQEIGMANALKKLVIPVVEKGVDLRGFQVGVEWLELDRANPQEFLTKLNPYIVRLAAAKEKSNIIAWSLLAGFAALALKSK